MPLRTQLSSENPPVIFLEKNACHPEQFRGFFVYYRYKDSF